MLLLFDLDGVLYETDVALNARALADSTGAEADRVETWLRSPAEDGSPLASPDPREYLADVARAIGAPVTLRQWAAARRAAMAPLRRSLAAFSIGASSGTAAVVTNNPSALLPAFPLVAPEVEQLVGAAGLVLSAAIGAAKPDPRIFEIAMARFGEGPDDTFFVDDVAENAAAAAALGITVLHFDGDEGALLDAVQAFVRARG